MSKSYKIAVDMDAETIGDHWENAKTKIKTLLSKFLISSVNSDTMKHCIENVTDVKVEVALKCMEVSSIGEINELFH